VLFILHGGCTILLGGDAPTEIWKTLYEALNEEMPKVNLLKAPHHGRKTGYYWPAVKAMAPDYTVVSIGKLKRKEDASASYEKYSERGCFTTRFQGNISAYCYTDGEVLLYNQAGETLSK
jgi:beta-lactamase superfamily II metal-dependent hydrolase